MFQKRCKVLMVTVMPLILVLGLVSVASADDPIYKLVGTNAGQKIYGTHNNNSNTQGYWAGIIRVENQDTNEKYGTYCTDINTATQGGVQYTINSDPNLDWAINCQIVYIMNRYPPATTRLSTLEAAARQAAIWYFSDGFVVDATKSPDVKVRAEAIIAEANTATNNGANCSINQSDVFIPELEIQRVGGSFQVVVKFPNGDPVVGLEVLIKTTGETVITDANGVASFSASNKHLEATASYLVTHGGLGATLVHINDPLTKQRLLLSNVDNGFITLNVDYDSPTVVTLVSFNIEANDGRAMVVWETGAEIDNAGFNLYRAASADGPWVKVNSALIAAKGDAVTEASYTFADTPGRGTFYYQLEDIDYAGVSTLHDPVMAEMGAIFRTPWFRPSLPNF